MGSQRSSEWLAWRASGITATDISAIMGVNPYKTALDIYNDKAGFGKEIFDSPSMQRGRDYETEALNKYSLDTNKIFAPLCVQDGIFRASLDGYCDEGILIEIKIPLEKNFESQVKNPPVHYLYQIQWQMMIVGIHVGTLVFYNPEDKCYETVDIGRDPELQAAMIREANLFWDNFQNGIPPECNVDDCLELTSPDAIKLANLLERAIEARKESESIEKALKQQLIDLGDGGDFRCGKIVVKFIEGSKTLDKDAMERDNIDLAKYQKSAKSFWKVTVKK